ncbi:MAG: HlyD family efflux transporter periplasmic adaptor subunit [Anaerolineales bacterium]|nr:HlyD family efflux transporter periplasmic adaptor subunit [Anaerolineales bacterium]
MKRNRIAWIGLALFVIIAGGFLYLTLSAASGDSNQGQLAGEDEIQGAVARTGDLILSVSGSGELVSVSEAGLSFQEQGELVELNVHVGDQVQTGDVLARLQIDQTAAELAANLTSAELEVLRAQQNLDQLYENAEFAAAQALVALEGAQLAVEELLDDELEQALAQQALHLAEEAVQEAEMNLYIVNSSPSQEAIDIAYASLLFKEKDLKEMQLRLAQTEYQFKSAPNQVVRDRLNQQILNLRVQLANQQLEYENALYKYNTLDDPPEMVDLTVGEAQLSTAQAQLAEAQKNWEEVESGPKESDLAVAEAKLGEAQAELDNLKDGPDPDEIVLAEAQLAKAEAKLAMLQAEQLVLDLVAPMDGTVLSISAEVGDRINNQTILTLADLSQPRVEVFLDEADSADIQVGNQAEIIFDAIPELIFEGQVVEIDPGLSRIGNTQGLRVVVVLDPLPNELIKLHLGLNAAADIITGEATNAVLVTVEALEQQDDGSYSVYVINGETIEQRPVQVGLMDATTAEIVAGLQSREQVAIGNLNFDQE